MFFFNSQPAQWLRLGKRGIGKRLFLCLCDPLLGKPLAPVVQKLDNANNQINRYPVDMCQQNKPEPSLNLSVSMYTPGWSVTRTQTTSLGNQCTNHSYLQGVRDLT